MVAKVVVGQDQAHLLAAQVVLGPPVDHGDGVAPPGNLTGRVLLDGEPDSVTLGQTPLDGGYGGSARSLHWLKVHCFLMFQHLRCPQFEILQVDLLSAICMWPSKLPITPFATCAMSWKVREHGFRWFTLASVLLHAPTLKGLLGLLHLE